MEVYTRAITHILSSNMCKIHLSHYSSAVMEQTSVFKPILPALLPGVNLILCQIITKRLTTGVLCKREKKAKSVMTEGENI